MNDKELTPHAGNGELNQAQFLRIPPGYEVVVDHGGAPPGEAEHHLWDHVMLVWRRRWLVLSAFLICFVPAVLLSYFSRPLPIYEASARLRTGIDSPDVLPFKNDDTRPQKDPIDTYIEILRSPSLAREVVTELNLFAGLTADAPSDRATSTTSAVVANALPPPVSKIQSGYRHLVSRLRRPAAQPTPLADPAAAAMQMRVDAMLFNLRVLPVVNTQIIEIRYASPDPELSAKVLNSLCQAYLRYDFNSKAESYAEARRWLQDKMDEMKGKLAESEQALFAFTGSSGKDFLALSDNAEEYYKQLDATKRRLAEVEDMYLSRQFELEQLKAGTPPRHSDKGG